MACKYEYMRYKYEWVLSVARVLPFQFNCATAVHLYLVPSSHFVLVGFLETISFCQSEAGSLITEASLFCRGPFQICNLWWFYVFACGVNIIVSFCLRPCVVLGFAFLVVSCWFYWRMVLFDICLYFEYITKHILVTIVSFFPELLTCSVFLSCCILYFDLVFFWVSFHWIFVSLDLYSLLITR